MELYTYPVKLVNREGGFEGRGRKEGGREGGRDLEGSRKLVAREEGRGEGYILKKSKSKKG